MYVTPHLHQLVSLWVQNIVSFRIKNELWTEIGILNGTQYCFHHWLTVYGVGPVLLMDTAGIWDRYLYTCELNFSISTIRPLQMVWKVYQ